jgi:hypothetical protein
VCKARRSLMRLRYQESPANAYPVTSEQLHVQTEVGFTASEASEEMARKLLPRCRCPGVSHGGFEPVLGVHAADPTLWDVTVDDGGTPSGVGYAEVLRAPWWTWLFPPLAGAFLGFAYGYALGARWGWLTAAVLTLLGIWLLLARQRLITVSDSGLQVGKAVLPLWAIGEVRSLDAQASLDARRHLAHADAYLVLRTGSSDRTVAVGVADESDPHPYWLISTKHPEELVSAIVGARDSGTRTGPSTSSSTP